MKKTLIPRVHLIRLAHLFVYYRIEITRINYKVYSNKVLRIYRGGPPQIRAEAPPHPSRDSGLPIPSNIIRARLPPEKPFKTLQDILLCIT